MLGQILTIARNTFLESVRQPIYFILIALCGIFQLLTTWSAGFSMDYSSTAEVSADDKLLLDIGMATVFVCGMLASAFLATAVISKEIERKTVLTVVSKPVSRPTLVLGKYLGVSTAIVIAGATMLLFLQMSIRHKVMSTTADDIDGPVIVFTLLAVGISLVVGVWCNFFYGWVFTQTATMLLFPLMLAAWLGVLLVGKGWKVQPMTTDFKTQIGIASICLILAQLVLTSIATAASARLGQVMTLLICCGVFMLGLTSNYFLGSRAISNQFVGRIAKAEPEVVGMTSLQTPGDTYLITLDLEPRVRLVPGTPFYFGPNPSGFGMQVTSFPKFQGDISDSTAVFDRSKPATLTVVSQTVKAVKVIRTGADGPLVRRPPQAGDYVFTRPTVFNAAALAGWAMIPNIQAFWLVDAVSQNQPIPLSHLGLIALYSLAQVGVFLSLAVVLFQRREVG